MFKGNIEQVINDAEASTSGTYSTQEKTFSISSGGKYGYPSCRSLSGKLEGSYAFSFCWCRNAIPSPYLMWFR